MAKSDFILAVMLLKKIMKVISVHQSSVKMIYIQKWVRM